MARRVSKERGEKPTPIVQNWPFYDNLLIESENLTIEEKIWSSIGKLPGENLEIIYFLILHDYLLFQGDEKTSPYGARVQMGGKGMMFTVDKLPERVQKLIIAYLKKISTN